jgi:steroid 5-alpha reductase family enzyme
MLLILEGLIAALSRLVGSRIGQWIVQLFLFFGVQLVAQHVLIAPVKGALSAAFGGMPATVIGWIAYIKLDVFLTLIASAYAANAGTRFFMQRKTG